MAWVMGQPEVALRIMMRTNPAFCEAMNNVGYYRIGNQVVPVACGKQVVAGGIDSGASSRTTRVAALSSNSGGNSVTIPGIKKCEKGADNKVYIKYSYNADKAAAKAACLQVLGY